MATAAPVPTRTYDRAWWRDQLRRAAPLVALGVAAVIVAVIITPRPDRGLPLAPDSTAPDGTRALVEVLRGVGGDVDIATPDDLGDAVGDGAVVLLLRDQLSEAQRDALERRIHAGARVVVADPASPLVPATAGGLSALDRRLDRGCDVPALADTRRVEPGPGAVYEVTGDADDCFATETGAWLVAEPRGRGHVVAIGGATFLTNGWLAREDNAVLAVHLLTPGDAAGAVIVRPVLRTAAEEEAGGLLDLVPNRISAALWQVLIGFLVLVAWRARRLGAPLVESEPVRLAGAELMTAVGALLARHETRAASLERIVADVRRRLARRLGLPDGVDTGSLVERLSQRTGVDPATLRRRLDPPAPAGDAALLRATGDLADLEAAVDAAVAVNPEESDVD